MKKHVKRTFRPEVLTDLGGFGALFDLSALNYHKPVLVSGTDGVGTKLVIAIETGRHATIGIDLVAKFNQRLPARLGKRLGDAHRLGDGFGIAQCGGANLESSRIGHV